MAYFLGKGRVRLLVEEAEQIGLVHRQDLLEGLAALVEGGDVLLHGVPRDVHQARDGSRSVSCHVTAQNLFDS